MSMSRRKISTVLIAFVALLICAAVGASDFWLSKDWKQWSKSDCESMLVESPWAHTWRGGKTENIDPGSQSSTRTQGTVGFGLVFSVQLRSSLPLRQAIVRQQQIDQKYDKMSADQRTAFDTRAEQILNRNYEDTILVHVDFSKGDAAGNLGSDLRRYAQMRENLHVTLVTDDGVATNATRSDLSSAGGAFDAVFPRSTNGALVIKDGQKGFSIRFQSPQLLIMGDVNIPAQPVEVKFDLSKMLVNGKLNF